MIENKYQNRVSNEWRRTVESIFHNLIVKRTFKMNALNSIILWQIFSIFASSHSATFEQENYIVGGSASGPGQFPFVASLRTLFNVHQCGGCIISNRWILTSAHCTWHGRPNLLLVAIGAHTQSDGYIYRIDTVAIHPNYNPEGVVNDIALIRTINEIAFISGRIQPAQLPGFDLTEGGRITAYLAGWGFIQVNNFKQ